MPTVSTVAGEAYSPDRVYLTTDEDAARAYAGLYMSPSVMRQAQAGVAPSSLEGLGGAVYEVEPLGPVEPDRDDSAPGLSWQTTRARVVRVIDPHVAPGISESEAAMGRAQDAARQLPDGSHGAPKPSKLGRNDPCWCGSGKKFKRCHGG
jgi:hypothetical protein